MSLSPRPEDHALCVMGGIHEAGQTIFLLGPKEPGFWDHFTQQPEFKDGLPDPMDRWSKRVIGALATQWGGTAKFPSDGPPYPPFQDWAQRSERAWVSPVGMLVHADAGLMISYRGAIQLNGHHPLPGSAQNPCETCELKPCLNTCPVGALGAQGYDVETCRGFINSEPGQDCMNKGCAVRRSCPVSQNYGRKPEQSAFHMKAFA